MLLLIKIFWNLAFNSKKPQFAVIDLKINDSSLPYSSAAYTELKIECSVLYKNGVMHTFNSSTKEPEAEESL